MISIFFCGFCAAAVFGKVIVATPFEKSAATCEDERVTGYRHVDVFSVDTRQLGRDLIHPLVLAHVDRRHAGSGVFGRSDKVLAVAR